MPDWMIFALERGFRRGLVEVNHAMERPVDPPRNRVASPNMSSLQNMIRLGNPVYLDVPVKCITCCADHFEQPPGANHLASVAKSAFEDPGFNKRLKMFAKCHAGVLGHSALQIRSKY